MKLIVLNGPPGSGKSTVAKAIRADLPLSFLVDIDEQRRFISEYEKRPEESRELVFAVAPSIVEACLREGVDVIVDKMIWPIDNCLDQLCALGEKYGAEVHEFIFWADKETAHERVDGREKKGVFLTPEKIDRYWEESKRLKDERPNATVIDTDKMTEDEVVATIKKSLGLT